MLVSSVNDSDNTEELDTISNEDISELEELLTTVSNEDTPWDEKELA